MRHFFAILTALILSISGTIQAAAQTEVQASPQEPTAEQQQAQKYFAEFRGMVMIYYVDAKCDVLDALELKAVLMTQADRLDTLVEMGGATGEQLNEVMASIEGQIAADTCENLFDVPNIEASYQLAGFYRDFYSAIWNRYLAAAAQHEAAGGDSADFKCGSQSFADIKAIAPLTDEAIERLKLRDDYSRMSAEATSQAGDVRQLCTEYPAEADNTPLVEYMTVAQAVIAEQQAE